MERRSLKGKKCVKQRKTITQRHRQHRRKVVRHSSRYNIEVAELVKKRESLQPELDWVNETIANNRKFSAKAYRAKLRKCNEIITKAELLNGEIWRLTLTKLRSEETSPGQLGQLMEKFGTVNVYRMIKRMGHVKCTLRGLIRKLTCNDDMIKTILSYGTYFRIGTIYDIVKVHVGDDHDSPEKLQKVIDNLNELLKTSTHSA